MKKFAACIVAFLLFVSFAACGEFDVTSESSVAPEATATPTAEPTEEPTATPEPTEEPTSEPEEDVVPEIDWDKLVEDFKADMSVFDQPFYKDVYVGCDGDTITISAVVAADTDDDTVLEYADTLVRRLGALANQQNSEFTSPGFESFGGLYDYYNVMIGIAPQGSEGDLNNWYIYDAIAKGVQTKHKFRITRK